MIQVDDMVDVIGARAQALPGHLRKVAGYVTGAGGVEWSAEDWAHFPNAAKVRLSQRNAEAILSCDGFDIEDLAWTIPVALDGAQLRRHHHVRTDLYFPEGMLEEVDTGVQRADLEDWVDYWVANPSLSRDQAIARLGGHGGRIRAWQWAFPSTNPRTIVPGTRLTVAEASCDLSVTLQSWHPIPGTEHKKHGGRRIIHAVKHGRPTKKVIAGLGGAGSGVGLVAILNAYGVHLTPAEAAAVPSILSGIAAWAKREEQLTNAKT